MRHYAAERLGERGDAELRGVRVAHRDFYLALAERAAPELFGSDQVAWLDRLEIEHANLGAALAFCIADPASRELGLRIAGSLGWFWDGRGYYAEGVEVLEALLDAPEVAGPSLVRARALNAASTLLGHRDLGASAARAAEARSIARRHGDRSLEAEALTNLSWLSFRQHDLRSALGRADEAVDLARDLRDTRLVARCFMIRAVARSELGDLNGAREDDQEALAISKAAGDHRSVVQALNNLGASEVSAGAFGVARAYLEEALTVAQHTDPSLLSYWYLLDSLGWLEVFDGAHTRARRLFIDSLTKAVRAGVQTDVASSLLGLAVIAGVNGDERLACTLHGAADQLSERAELTLERFLIAERDRDQARLRQAMGDTAFTAACRHGRALPYADAIAIAAGKLENNSAMQMDATNVPQR